MEYSELICFPSSRAKSKVCGHGRREAQLARGWAWAPPQGRQQNLIAIRLAADAAMS